MSTAVLVPVGLAVMSSVSPTVLRVAVPRPITVITVVGSTSISPVVLGEAVSKPITVSVRS